MTERYRFHEHKALHQITYNINTYPCRVHRSIPFGDLSSGLQQHVIPAHGTTPSTTFHAPSATDIQHRLMSNSVRTYHLFPLPEVAESKLRPPTSSHSTPSNQHTLPSKRSMSKPDKDVQTSRAYTSQSGNRKAALSVCHELPMKYSAGAARRQRLYPLDSSVGC